MEDLNQLPDPFEAGKADALSDVKANSYSEHLQAILRTEAELRKEYFEGLQKRNQQRPTVLKFLFWAIVVLWIAHLSLVFSFGNGWLSKLDNRVIIASIISFGSIASVGLYGLIRFYFSTRDLRHQFDVDSKHDETVGEGGIASALTKFFSQNHKS